VKNELRMNLPELFLFLVLGYIATVAIEVPVLIAGLTRRHNLRTRFTCGLLLTAFTYPIVVLVLPATVLPYWGQTIYLAIAESYAPLAEVLFFRFMTNQKLPAALDRDAVVIMCANLLSFALGAAFLSDWILAVIRSCLNGA